MTQDDYLQAPGDIPQNKPLAAAVARILKGHTGKGWAIRRGEILKLVQGLPVGNGATDRTIRGAVEDCREAGMLICNLADDRGYFLPETQEEYLQFRALYCSYAKTIEARLAKMDQTAANIWGAGALQEKLF